MARPRVIKSASKTVKSKNAIKSVSTLSNENKTERPVLESKSIHRTSIFELLGKKWFIEILFLHSVVPKTFSEMYRLLETAVSPTIFTRRLSELQKLNLTSKMVVHGKPFYTISDKGQMIKNKIYDMDEAILKDD